jgi:hypothetical protein
VSPHPPTLAKAALLAGLWAVLPPARAQTAPTAPPVPPSGDVTFPFRPYTFVVGALSTSALLVPDSVCPDPNDVCPFGGGGGIFVGGGSRYHRAREWLAGYDLSLRNARNLFSSATLQQVRIEHRWLFFATPVHNFEAFAGVSGGVALFGELLGVRTVGVTAGLSAGGTYNLGAFVRLGVAARLDATRFLVPFIAGDGVLRADGGVATVSGTLMLLAEFLGQ